MRGSVFFFGGGAIDLDLAAFVEFNDGSRAVIQALGNGFGDYSMWPYVKLLGDDRTGSSSTGEFININGDHWSEIERVLIYAFIYEGTPSWDKANAHVRITLPDQPEITGNLDSSSTKHGCCAIALLSNEYCATRASKEIRYFENQEPMDHAYGFGFRWQAGSK